MSKWAAAIAGAILLLAGVGVAIWHYTRSGPGTESFVTLAIAAVVLLVGWTLFDWGLGISKRWGAGQGKDKGDKYPPDRRGR